MLNHQISDTFSTTASSEHSWTEKIWSAMVRKDGEPRPSISDWDGTTIVA